MWLALDGQERARVRLAPLGVLSRAARGRTRGCGVEGGGGVKLEPSTHGVLVLGLPHRGASLVHRLIYAYLDAALHLQIDWMIAVGLC